MAFFKKLLGKDKASAASIKSKEAKSERPVKDAAVESDKPKAPASINVGAGIGILIAPHITEKTTDAGQHGTYTFRVHSGSNKIRIREAVEKRYGVRVGSIRITKAKPKVKRFGRRFGTVPGYAKAVVRLEKGQSIEVGA